VRWWSFALERDTAEPNEFRSTTRILEAIDCVLKKGSVLPPRSRLDEPGALHVEAGRESAEPVASIALALHNHIQQDADFDSLRSLPEFAEIMKTGRLDRSYSAVWDGAFRFEAIALYGLDPAALEAQPRSPAEEFPHQLAESAGCRPA